MTRKMVKAWPITEGQAFRVSGRQGAKAAKPMAGCGKKKCSRAAKGLFVEVKRLAGPRAGLIDLSVKIRC